MYNARHVVASDGLDKQISHVHAPHHGWETYELKHASTWLASLPSFLLGNFEHQLRTLIVRTLACVMRAFAREAGPLCALCARTRADFGTMASASLADVCRACGYMAVQLVLILQLFTLFKKCLTEDLGQVMLYLINWERLAAAARRIRSLLLHGKLEDMLNARSAVAVLTRTGVCLLNILRAATALCQLWLLR